MNEELFQELIISVRQGGAILRGEAQSSRSFEVDSAEGEALIADAPDVRQIREGYHLSQPEFAILLGISVGTLRNWEQGRRAPEGPARVLLRVAAQHPQAVWDVVRPRPTKETSRQASRRRTPRRSVGGNSVGRSKNRLSSAG